MSTYFDADAVKQQYGEYETARLMRIALATTDEYGEEAIDLARQELTARGIHDARFDIPPGGQRRLLPRHVRRPVAAMAVGEGVAGDDDGDRGLRPADAGPARPVAHGMDVYAGLPPAHRGRRHAFPAARSPLVRTPPRLTWPHAETRVRVRFSSSRQAHYWINDSCATTMRHPSGSFRQTDVATTRTLPFLPSGIVLATSIDCSVLTTSGAITVISGADR